MLKASACPFCGQDFEYDTATARHKRFCSVACQRRAAHRKWKENVERRCPKRGVTKPATEFSSGSHSYCRPCAAQYMRERRVAIPDQIVRYRRTTQLRRYGITMEQFDQLVQAQGGRCAICRTDVPGGNGIWRVDHDHACCSGRKNSCGNCIRGLLCSNCNVGLGMFGDDPDRLRAAILYIEKFRAGTGN